MSETHALRLHLSSLLEGIEWSIIQYYLLPLKDQIHTLIHTV